MPGTLLVKRHEPGSSQICASWTKEEMSEVKVSLSTPWRHGEGWSNNFTHF